MRRLKSYTKQILVLFFDVIDFVSLHIQFRPAEIPKETEKTVKQLFKTNASHLIGL